LASLNGERAGFVSVKVNGIVFQPLQSKWVALRSCAEIKQHIVKICEDKIEARNVVLVRPEACRASA
jgi:hypothetical protein